MTLLGTEALEHVDEISLPFKDLKVKRASLILDERLLLVIYASAVLIVTIQRGVFGFPNDFAIFRASFWNLIENKDLYVLRLDQAHDYFKYSPSFALLFAPFAILPFGAGLFFWNLVNAIGIFFALRWLLPREQSALAQVLVALPTLRSIQSSQSNALVAALIIVAFVSFERGWLWRGAVAIAPRHGDQDLPAGGAQLRSASAGSNAGDTDHCPQHGNSGCASTDCNLTGSACRSIPVLGRTRAQRSRARGSSAMELFRDAGITWPVWPVQLIAAAIVLAVLILRMRDWNDRNLRLQFLGFVMVFCVVFNHRAERQSAVIALSGMVIWYLASPRRNARRGEPRCSRSSTCWWR